mmetsp:Transcript_4089/g.8424  ORF Transcript_4089/g.8424 Transcript_4089/m.8424 type:complete len:295 (-) Transcript_4089:525-1409(-)
MRMKPKSTMRSILNRQPNTSIRRTRSSHIITSCQIPQLPMAPIMIMQKASYTLTFLIASTTKTIAWSFIKTMKSPWSINRREWIPCAERVGTICNPFCRLCCVPLRHAGTVEVKISTIASAITLTMATTTTTIASATSTRKTTTTTTSNKTTITTTNETTINIHTTYRNPSTDSTNKPADASWSPKRRRHWSDSAICLPRGGFARVTAPSSSVVLRRKTFAMATATSTAMATAIITRTNDATNLVEMMMTPSQLTVNFTIQSIIPYKTNQQLPTGEPFSPRTPPDWMLRYPYSI